MSFDAVGYGIILDEKQCISLLGSITPIPDECAKKIYHETRKKFGPQKEYIYVIKFRQYDDTLYFVGTLNEDSDYRCGFTSKIEKILALEILGFKQEDYLIFAIPSGSEYTRGCYCEDTYKDDLSDEEDDPAKSE